MYRQMRRFKQQVSDERCKELLREQWRGSLNMIGDNGYPYAIPINFYYDEEDNRLYFHMAKVGHKIDAINACDKVSFTIWDEGYREPGDWALYITSVIVWGRASFVTDPVLREAKLRLLGAKYFPESVDLDKEIEDTRNQVCLMAIDIEHMTGKLVHEN